MRSPLITIGIPTRNRAVSLVRSVESAIAQEDVSLEVVVSDNASDDETPAALDRLAAADPRVRILRQETDLGMVGNFNACLTAAQGEYFLLLSDDDLLERNALSKLVAPLVEDDALARPELSLSWCPARIIDAEGNARWTTQAGPVREPGLDLVCGLFSGTRGPRLCGILLRTRDACALGGFAPAHGPICDVGCWTRIAARYPQAACIPEPLVRYMMHAGSISSQPRGRVWQEAGEKISADLVSELEQAGRPADARRVARHARDNVTNLLATVMLQCVGKPGWVRYWLGELRRAPGYLLTPMVLRRVARDGWKIFR